MLINRRNRHKRRNCLFLIVLWGQDDGTMQCHPSPARCVLRLRESLQSPCNEDLSLGVCCFCGSCHVPLPAVSTLCASPTYDRYERKSGLFWSIVGYLVFERRPSKNLSAFDQCLFGQTRGNFTLQIHHVTRKRSFAPSLLRKNIFLLLCAEQHATNVWPRQWRLRRLRSVICQIGGQKKKMRKKTRS